MRTKMDPAYIDGLIEAVDYLREGTVTVCILTLTNGCQVVGKSNVIDPANYDQELGEQAALSNTKAQIWELEGYALKRNVTLQVEAAAKAAHEANRIYCITLGDTSQPTWDGAPDWQKVSAISGVQAILENPDITPAEQHEMWMKHKLEDGWAFGLTKDPALKTHPCIVPYTMLPTKQQIKDELFGSVVRAVLG